MKQVRVLNTSRNVVIAESAGLASNILSRGLGLSFRRSLPEGSGLVLMPGGQIHMFFMRFALDVLHIDGKGAILRILVGIKPWRVGPFVRKCRLVIELPTGTVARTGTVVGDVVALEDLPT